MWHLLQFCLIFDTYVDPFFQSYNIATVKNKLYEWTKEANLKCYRCQQSQLNSCHTEKWKWKWNSTVRCTINNWENSDKKRINISAGMETILENWPFCFSSLNKGVNAFAGRYFPSEQKKWKIKMASICFDTCRVSCSFPTPYRTSAQSLVGLVAGCGNTREVKILLNLASLRGVKTYL